MAGGDTKKTCWYEEWEKQGVQNNEVAKDASSVERSVDNAWEEERTYERD